MKLTCKTKCFVKSKLWLPGETLEVDAKAYAEAVKDPKTNPYAHFVESKDFKPETSKEPAKDPKTLKELGKGTKQSDELLS